MRVKYEHDVITWLLSEYLDSNNCGKYKTNVIWTIYKTFVIRKFIHVVVLANGNTNSNIIKIFHKLFLWK